MDTMVGWKDIAVSPLPLKEDIPIVRELSGMVIVFNAVQPLKQLSGILLKASFCERFTVANKVAPLKAECPIFSTVLGMVMVLILVDANTFAPMVVIPSGIVTVATEVFAKRESAKEVTGYSPKSEGMETVVEPV